MASGRIPALEHEDSVLALRHGVSPPQANPGRSTAVSPAQCPTGPMWAAISPVKALAAGMDHRFRTAASPVKPTAVSLAPPLATRRAAIRRPAHLEAVELAASAARRAAFRPRARSADSEVAATLVGSEEGVTSAVVAATAAEDKSGRDSTGL